MSEWQPADTAPTDNSPFLAYFAQFRAYGVLMHNAHGDWYDEDDAFYSAPTHWMPLPEPPQ